MPVVTEPGFVRRTRWSYDAGADDFAAWIREELAAKPLDRAVLSGFAELARHEGGAAPWPMSDAGRAA